MSLTQILTDSRVKRLKGISREMEKLREEDSLKEHNKLVPVWRELRTSIDYGYRVGDLVDYRIGKYKWGRGRIKEIDETWQVTFHNIIVPVEFLRRVDYDDQLSLFGEEGVLILGNGDKHFKFARELRKKDANLDFEDFENKVIVEFEDEADQLDIQELYTTYYL